MYELVTHIEINSWLTPLTSQFKKKKFGGRFEKKELKGSLVEWENLLTTEFKFAINKLQDSYGTLGLCIHTWMKQGKLNSANKMSIDEGATNDQLLPK